MVNARGKGGKGNKLPSFRETYVMDELLQMCVGSPAAIAGKVAKLHVHVPDSQLFGDEDNEMGMAKLCYVTKGHQAQ